MKKSDLLLAQKSLQAKQVKHESNMIREELHRTRATTSGSNLGSLGSSNRSSFSKTSSLPELKQVSSPKPANSSFSSSGKLQPISESKAQESFDMASSMDNTNLINELAQRSVTDKTFIRKQQFLVSKSLQDPQNNSRGGQSRGNNVYSSSSSMRPHTTSSSTPNLFSRGGQSTIATTNEPTPILDPSNFEMNDNYFMPKRTILRPDGASLIDIYKSKRDDTWGKIIKAQYKEDEYLKTLKKKEKDRSNEEYGRKLREQVEEHTQKKVNETKENDLFAALEDATTKRNEDLQRKRDQDAINRHKQFISNALHDMQLKQQQHEKYLREELFASTVMMNNVRKLMNDDEQKKQQLRNGMKQYQEQMYQENLDNIARKQKNKMDSFAEDKRIIQEQERIFQTQKQRRENELAHRMKQSSEGPAHYIFKEIVKLKHQHDDQLHQHIYHAENSLNKQLKDSEDTAKRRAAANGQSLNEEWEKNTLLRTQKKLEDEERNNRIIQTMHDMIRKQEREDIEKRERQRQAALKYQRELDVQVNALRQRSIDSLQKTMNEEEQKYNTEMIKKATQWMD